MAVAISIISILVALITLIIGVAIGAINTAALIGFLATVGVAIPSLIGALKATEAADTVSEVRNEHQTIKTSVEYTASQNAAILQVLTAHCGEVCPRPDCPFRGIR